MEQEGSGFIQRRGSVLFLGSRRGRKRQEVGTELKEVKVGYVISHFRNYELIIHCFGVSGIEINRIPRNTKV